MGSGLSGICAAIRLRKKQITDFIVLEKASGVGGTWRDNSYPGIACDVPAHLYSFSFELKPDWPHFYPSGREIHDYCQMCVDKYHLASHIQLNAQVESAEFDGRYWQIRLTDGRRIEASVLISGLGGLHSPKHPDIEGLESFAGDRFHTAEWNHNCSLEGKRVGIIGTGASSVQVLPAIADQASSIKVFQRSAAWVFPRIAHKIPESRQALYRRHPWLMRLNRWRLWLRLDILGMLSLRRDSRMNRRSARLSLGYLERKVKDPELRKKLTPDYEVGCKRRCISDDYFSTFNQPHVELITDAISSVDKDGIRDETGQHHSLDVIIEATGFHPISIADQVAIRGREGKPLSQAWADGIKSFRTVMVPNFPNFFMLLGPNSITGHTSALIMIESQVDYMIKCLMLAEREGYNCLEPKADFTDGYNERLQKDMKRMTFDGGCGAWYTTDRNHNFTLWPRSAMLFVLELFAPNRSEFLFS